MEGSLVAYKVFTNGSTLQASELNENLMQQAVSTFSNAATRTAAITSPVEGQLTYLEDVNRYEHYNGSTWVSPFGETLLSTVSFTSQSAVSLSSVFSSSYQNYRLAINATFSSATSVDLRARLRLVSTDTTNQYFGTGISTNHNSTTITVNNVNTGVSFFLATSINTLPLGGEVRIYQPNIADKTSITSHINSSTALVEGHIQSGLQNSNTQFDGITLFPSAGTFTGTVRLYGLRNNA